MYRRGGGKRDHNNKTVKKNESDSKKYAELLVFGYACKLFRDDERAHFHEQGKQLIPWMGDKNILIDRYDGRGHLHDLSEYDAGSWNRDYQLSEEEARIEALCDEERYLAMHTDLLEEEARQEEEYKRLSEALADEGTYNSVGFRYSADYYDPSQPTEEEEANRETEEAEPQESEEPYVAPPGLAIPPDVELPATTKTHAIIERTANFVCQQGAQFEIVLKAKQSGNSQFDFLNFEHYLNPYYKHILKAMKEGRYTPASDKQDSQDSDDSDDDGDGNYLHPSLFAPKKSSRLEELMKPLQVMDPDHPLAALIRKTQQERNGAAAAAAAIMATKLEEVPAEPAVPATPAEYIADRTTPPAPPEPSTRIIYTAPPTTFPIIPPPNPVPSQVPVCLSTPSPPAPVIPAAVIPETSLRPQAPIAVAAPVAVAAPAIIPPPPDIQPVIDKLAEYVARNGVKFETSVRAKNDPRFDFLQSWNQYNTYYEFKKNYFMQKEGISLPQRGSSDGLGPAEGEADRGSVGNCPSDKQLNEGKPIKVPFAPICFAIKAKENDMLPLEKNRVRLDDDSDDDPDKLLGEEGLEALLEGAEMVVRAVTATPEEKRPTLTLEELEAKQAKQKLEDRLAAAAREKLAQASKESKEKQLQAERKRKAALFLQTLRNPLTGEPETRHPDKTTAMPEPQLPEVPVAPVVSAPPHLASRAHVYPADQRPHDVSAFKSKEPPSSSSTLLLPSSSSTSRRPEKNRDREKGDREKKKKKRKKRSRSRSRSRPKTKHALPSAYRMVRRSRSRSKSPGRRDRRAHSSERRREERERYGTAAYRVGISPALPRRHSRSRSPHEKRKRKSSKGKLPTKGSSCSPSSYPRGAKKSPSASPPTSPTSSLSRDGSQEKEKQVSTAIVSSMQSKITQDLMAKVRAMLASSKTSQPNTP
ncbi:splicing factor, suppressor of white-apricot homolog isoform X3 [Oncorhynchus clarkii lewisi]|uniref:splicing factor, suppressor of white-apricot homolog isoform X3 n=1 Tax=Oncorhynchus clarkii lewisi TaxID=490388 RepID=UPI0039B895BB